MSEQDATESTLHPDGVTAMLAGVALKHTAEVLGAAGVPVAPLKGVLWHATLYGNEEHRRPIRDVDVLVPSHMFARAKQALLDADYEFMDAGDDRERTLRPPQIPIDVDLHRALFPAARYRLTTGLVFSRCQPDDIFGAPTWRLHPYDQLAHLLGHHICSHHPTAPREREDFARLVAHHSIDAGAFARFAESAGMARTVRCALARLSDARTQGFSRKVLAHLAPDPLGAWLSHGFDNVLEGVDPLSASAAAAAYALSRSLPSGAYAAWLAWRSGKAKARAFGPRSAK